MYDESASAVAATPLVSFRTIKKRSGDEVAFCAEKITKAIQQAARATGEFGADEARRLTIRVLSLAQTVCQYELFSSRP